MVNFFCVLIIICTILGMAQAVDDVDKTVLKADLPYIGCDVCMLAMSEIYYVSEAHRRNTTYGKLKEETIIDVIDKVCAARSKDGIWMRTLDIVDYKEDGKRYLKLDTPGGLSTCGRECGTIEKSCVNLFDEEIDRDELTVYIWQNKYTTVEELQDKACRKLSNRCKKGDKNVPMKAKAKRVDFPFHIITEKELSVERMLANMRASGTGGHLLSTAEMQAMNRRDDYEEGEEGYQPSESIDENGNTMIHF